MRSFSFDSRFYQALALAGELVLVNLVMVVAMVPGVTAGAAVAACFVVCFAILSGDAAQPVRRFVDAFVRLFVPATLLWLGMVGLALLLGWEWRVVGQFRSGTAMLVVHAVIGLVAGLLAVVGVWCWPIMARRFAAAGRVETAAILPLARAALLAGLRYLPRTLAALAVTAGPLAFGLALPGLGVRLVFWYLVIGLSLACYLVALLVRGPLGVHLPEDSED